MSCWGIYLTHLPHGITAPHLENQLRTNKAVGKYFLDRPLSVLCYGPKTKTVAVITRLCCDFEKLFLDFRGVQLTSSESEPHLWGNIVVKNDTGEARDNDTGKYLVKRPSHFRKEEHKYSGETEKKCLGIFNDDLLNSIPDELLSGYRSMIYIHCEGFRELKREQVSEIFRRPGVVTYEYEKSQECYGLKYEYQLNLIQAMTYLNGNEDVFSTAPEITDNNGENKVTCLLKMGLGKGGTFLDIPKIIKKHEYVPLSHFDERRLNLNAIRRIYAICSKCHHRFDIRGVNSNLNYLTGVCKCDYDHRLDATNPKKAFFWEEEKFTRLVPFQKFQKAPKAGPIHFEVLLEPIKKEYLNTDQYKQMYIPLLEKEKAFKEQTFRKDEGSNKFGRIESCEDLKIFSQQETRQMNHEKESNNDDTDQEIWCAIRMKIPKTDVFQKDNPQFVSDITFHSGANQTKDVTGTVFRMEDCDNGKSTMVFLQAKIAESCRKSWMAVGNKVCTTPIPNSSEHRATLKLLNEWSKRSPKNVLECLMLGMPCQDFKISNTSKRIQLKLDPLSAEALKRKFTRDLNTEQLSAFTKAEENNFSGIHGLPGTGKSKLIAAIVAYLSGKEAGRILVCAPSNHACDDIGNKLLSIKLPDIKILRIMSQTRALHCSSSSSLVSKIPTLTSLLLNDERWLKPNNIRSVLTEKDGSISDDEMGHIIDCALKNRLDHLNLKHRRALQKHKQDLEGKIIAKYDIIISTVGALANGHLKSWSINENQQFTTIILDEAAQLLHPSTLFLSGFNAIRYVFAGDHQQLPPCVLSSCASQGGLDISLMQAVHYHAVIVAEKSRINQIPWTVLTTQYRMNPSIYRLVMEVTYPDVIPENNDNNGDFFIKACKNKSINTPWMIRLRESCNFVSTERVIVLNHNGLEERIGTSYWNMTEVEWIVESVRKFLTFGVETSQITIVSMYDLQTRMITKALANNGITGVDVGNTDSVQGRENDIIILSLVRNNKDSNIGFLVEANRLNVAISRARHLLVIPCAFDKFYRRLDLQHWKTFKRMMQSDSSKSFKIISKW